MADFWEKVIFDSLIHRWDKNSIDFQTKVHNESNILFLFETSDLTKFGFFVGKTRRKISNLR